MQDNIDTGWGVSPAWTREFPYLWTCRCGAKWLTAAVSQSSCPNCADTKTPISRHPLEISVDDPQMARPFTIK